MSLSNVAASVRQRLLSRAREEGEDVQRLLVRYALERMLYRITASDRGDQFVLKGAFTFLLWQGTLHRSTRDLDLMGYGSPEPRAVEEVLREVCMTDAPDDGLRFDPSSVTTAPIRDQAEYDGLRVKLIAHLGSARIPLQVDIGFGDAITPDPETAEFPALLEFPAPRVRMYPRETVIAEKLHGLVRFGIANTRMKDYYDLWFLSEHFPFEGSTLQRAIQATFQRRGTALPDRRPVALTDEFARSGEKRRQWTAFLDRMELASSGLALPDAVHRVQAFLLPVLRALREEEPFHQKWPSSGPWDGA